MGLAVAALSGAPSLAGGKPRRIYIGLGRAPASSKRKIITKRNAVATEAVVLEGVGLMFMINLEFDIVLPDGWVNA